jgi:RNA polymerase sigma-70 factor (ECF subfamily)
MNQEMTKVEEAWLRYQQKLFSFIRSRVKTPEDAEDIVNDVFVKLAKAANDKTAPNDVSAWLYRVTKNRIVDYYRAMNRFEPLPDDLMEKQEETNTIQQLSKCILPMIQALPEIYQHPLALSVIEEKKHPEIAAELNLTLSAVKSRILRGKEKLNKSLMTCCSISRNTAGETVDYEQKSNRFCSDG